MKSHARGHSWTLELAPEWKVTQDPECLTITRSDEGELQISRAEKKTGRITGEELLEFVDDPSWGAPTANVGPLRQLLKVEAPQSRSRETC